jgi:ribose 5-phosphate isomerase B
MKIAIACDHAGFELKEQLLTWLKDLKYEILDFGTNSSDSVDYPDNAVPAAESVANGDSDFGIIICGSGIGMSIVCNKVKGIRSALCINPEFAELARKHNDANVLNLGARFTDLETAKNICNVFLNEKFEGNRHLNRVNKIHNLTGC